MCRLRKKVRFAALKSLLKADVHFIVMQRCKGETEDGEGCQTCYNLNILCPRGFNRPFPPGFSVRTP